LVVDGSCGGGGCVEVGEVVVEVKKLGGGGAVRVAFLKKQVEFTKKKKTYWVLKLLSPVVVDLVVRVVVEVKKERMPGFRSVKKKINKVT
jgi:hypothetical protein